MIYSVDVNEEYRKSRSKILRYSLLFSFSLAIVLTADVLLVVLSKENYIPHLIISIVITILFSWFAIYFFSNIFGDINARYRYFKGFDGGLKATEEVEVLKKEGEICLVNGLYVYPIHIKVFDGFSVATKVIYSLDSNIDLDESDKLTVTTYQRIIINAESHS